MEKFYRVDKGSKVYELYEKYENMSYKVNEAFKEYSSEIGLEAKEYYQDTTRLIIVPTINDREKFKGHFLSSDPGAFKKTSVYSKKWVKKCEELKLKKPERPNLWMFFDFHGKFYSRLIKIKERLYCSCESVCQFTPPEGFEEILGSEFYKAIEEEKMKNEDLKR